MFTDVYAADADQVSSVLVLQYVGAHADSEQLSLCVSMKRKNKRHLYFVIRTRSLERDITVGRAEKSV